MPYITKKSKDLIDAGMLPTNKGELNYKITLLMIEYLQTQEKVGYGTISETIAAANDAAAEMRRRLLDPYEDDKMFTNGDVYPVNLLALAHGVNTAPAIQEENV